mmetsp:Transcript_22864/g.39511  ORF Transcript_22864/g.39511 Transcript_22864/m.39511 type:complete len:235 (-) Transcript_22864:786-1490(-)
MASSLTSASPSSSPSCWSPAAISESTSCISFFSSAVMLPEPSWLRSSAKPRPCSSYKSKDPQSSPSKPKSSSPSFSSHPSDLLRRFLFVTSPLLELLQEPSLSLKGKKPANAVLDSCRSAVVVSVVLCGGRLPLPGGRPRPRCLPVDRSFEAAAASNAFVWYFPRGLLVPSLSDQALIFFRPRPHSPIMSPPLPALPWLQVRFFVTEEVPGSRSASNPSPKSPSEPLAPRARDI